MKLRKCFTILALLTLTGCHAAKYHPDDPEFSGIIPENRSAGIKSQGSLFSAGNNLTLFDDHRAHKIGDILTVVLTETTQATKAASTNLKREYSQESNNATIFGTTTKFKLPSSTPLTNTQGLNTAVNIESEGEFKGEADSSQNNSLKGEITVTISQILPNKHLMVRGEKWITLNKGAEFIRFTGIVRPEDVAADNKIMSNKIANTRIIYSGTGDLNNSNSVGWIARFFNSPIWPF